MDPKLATALLLEFHITEEEEIKTTLPALFMACAVNEAVLPAATLVVVG